MAAFFKISFSILSFAFSRRSCSRSSAADRSGLAMPVTASFSNSPPRSQLADAYAQLPSQLGLGVLAQRRLTNRFKLEFPSQFPAGCVFHRTPPQVSIALIEVSIQRGYLQFDHKRPTRKVSESGGSLICLLSGKSVSSLESATALRVIRAPDIGAIEIGGWSTRPAKTHPIRCGSSPVRTSLLVQDGATSIGRIEAIRKSAANRG